MAVIATLAQGELSRFATDLQLALACAVGFVFVAVGRSCMKHAAACGMQRASGIGISSLAPRHV